MRVAVPKETKPAEQRVGLLPAGAAQLVRDGHEVLVETGAGEGSGFDDDAYAAAGAEVADLDDATAYGLPATEEGVIDYIVGLHEQGKIRVGIYVHGTSEGFVPWEEPILDLPVRLRAALVLTDSEDPLGPVMTVMFTFIDEDPPLA